MPIEFTTLIILTLMAGSLWIPYIIGVNTAAPGSLGDTDPSDFSRPRDPGLHRPWVHRAYRAHLNLLEQGVPFAILVLILDRLDAFSALTAWTCAAFLALRIIHAAGMITGVTGFPARPMIFTAGWICLVVLGVAAFVG